MLNHQSATAEILKVTNVPLLDLKAQYASIRTEVLAAIDRVLESQHFILGPEVEALEGEVAAYSGCQYGIGVSSGTDALLVALMAIDIKPGDEVITTPYTFFATAGSIARLGAKPVFVDIDPITYNIDPKQIEAVITERTRAIMPVHLFGQMAEMQSVMEIAEKHHLYVIEDAAQAIGAEYRGKRAGSIGHLGCFSFFPSKNLGGFGDGGMVVTNDAALAERCRLLRGHGANPKYYHKAVGGNFRLDAIHAGVLRVKLQYLDEWTCRRQSNAHIYNRLFAELGITNQNTTVKSTAQTINEGSISVPLSLPQEQSNCHHIYNQYVIRSAKRDALIAHLKTNQIGCEVYYPRPMHLQECFADLGYKVGSFPESELAANTTLALPIYPELSFQMISRVAHVVTQFHSNETLVVA